MFNLKILSYKLNMRTNLRLLISSSGLLTSLCVNGAVFSKQIKTINVNWESFCPANLTKRLTEISNHH